jgi:hypothetical protein
MAVHAGAAMRQRRGAPNFCSALAKDHVELDLAGYNRDCSGAERGSRNRDCEPAHTFMALQPI